MKRLKKLFLIMFSIFLGVSFASCGKDSKKNKTNEESSMSQNSEESSDVFDYELALENLVENIDNNNYVIKGNDFEINVASENLVSYEYGNSIQNKDFVVMSVDDEVFQAFPKNNNLEHILFVQYGNSVEACTNQALVLNFITYFFGGNMFDAFTSLPEEDGLYVSHEVLIKELIQRLGTYSDIIFSSMENVYLKIDNEGATSCHFKVHVYNEVSRYDFDIEIDVTFGNAKENELAKAWINNPTYPENPTNWSINQLGVIDMLFNLYPNEVSGNALPFIEGASYALYLDPNSAYNGYVVIQDRHMTETQVNNYINVLKSNGFVETIDEEGDICYRKLLRSESMCYSEVYLGYGDGLILLLEEYYEFEHINNLDELNTLINMKSNGEYPKLDSDGVKSIDAANTIYEEYESYLYLSEYEFVYMVDIEFEDDFDIDSYVDSYIEKLEASGFEFINSQADPRFAKGNDEVNFRYNIDYFNNTLNIKFKTYKNYSLFEIDQVLDYYPDIMLGNELDYYTAHSSITHDFIVNSKNYELDFKLNAYFESESAALEFIDSYINLLFENDFYRVRNAGTGKTYEFRDYNGFIFGYDIMTVENSNLVGVLMTFARGAVA